MTDALIAVVRNSHDRLAGLLAPLTADELGSTSYDDDWSIAQVASHLGSQAEIFTLFLDAGLNGTPAPEFPVFQQIWARWDGSTAESQADQSISADDAFLRRIEGLDDATRATFSLEMFGRTADLAVMLGMRLGEHALHTWDIAVALDPSAVIAPDAVAALIDGIGNSWVGSGKPVDGLGDIVIETSDPARRFLLTTSPEVTLTATATATDEPLRLTGDQLIRLVAGRLDPVDGEDRRLAGLRSVFTGL